MLALVGATATGKTDLAEALAAPLGAEIVCADSRQLFAELEIGTGKPAPAARQGRPHHLFDALALGQHASAGTYARLARETCAAIVARGATPLLVGGSGLYLRALMEGLAAAPPRDSAVRAALLARAAAEGPGALHAELGRVDPESAARLAPADLQRVVRALEVWQTSGRTLTWWHRQPPAAPDHAARGAPARWRVVELRVPPAALAERIACRTHALFASGLIEETRALRERGLEAPLAALRAVGYDEALGLLDGRLTRAEAEERTSLRTRQLAKRQATWFRHQLDAARLDAGTGATAELERAALAALGAD